MTERLSIEELNHKFVSSLEDKVVSYSKLNYRPLELDLMPPLPLKIRVYIFNITSPAGGRTLGEHKIQLMTPKQKRGEKSNFDETDGRIVILAGYDSRYDVFVLWDAGLYRDFPFSRNVQVKGETIYNAFAGNVSTQHRTLRGRKKEVVVSSLSSRLSEALKMRIDKTLDRLIGVDRSELK